MNEDEFQDTVENNLDCIIKLFRLENYTKTPRAPENVERYIRLMFNSSIEVAISYGKTEASKVILEELEKEVYEEENPKEIE